MGNEALLFLPKSEYIAFLAWSTRCIQKVSVTREIYTKIFL